MLKNAATCCFLRLNLQSSPIINCGAEISAEKCANMLNSALRSPEFTKKRGHQKIVTIDYKGETRKKFHQDRWGLNIGLNLISVTCYITSKYWTQKVRYSDLLGSYVTFSLACLIDTHAYQ